MQYILILTEENSHIHTIFSDKGWGSLMGERAKNRGDLDVDDRNKTKPKKKSKEPGALCEQEERKLRYRNFKQCFLLLSDERSGRIAK